MHSTTFKVDIAKGGVSIDGADYEELEQVIRCKSPFHVAVDQAADLVRSNPALIDEPQANFAILDLLIEHVESRIFFAGDADEFLFALKQDVESLRVLNEAYSAWETALEKTFATRLISSGGGMSMYDYRLNNRFQRLLKREVSMLRSTNPRRALFIGSGPFPISAIWLHRNLGIPTDALDVSLDAVECSRDLINKLRLNNSINVIHESSPSYDVSAYDVIIIALLAKPKAQLLKNIYRSSKPDCELICRTSFGLRSVVYEPTIVSNEILEMFSIKDARIISGNTDDTISSLLLRKISRNGKDALKSYITPCVGDG